MGNVISSVFGGSGGGDFSQAQILANQAAQREIRRQFNETQENLRPFFEAGQEIVPQVTSSATPQGFGEMLRQIFSDIGSPLDALIDERTQAIQGQLAAGGLTRSGTALKEIANIPTDIGFALENLLSGRAGNIFSQGINAATNVGQLGANAAQTIANLFQQSGQAQAQGGLIDQQFKNNRIAGITDLALGIGKAGGLTEVVPQVASLFFSDPYLKENVEEVGEVNGLTVYQWDWIPSAKNTMVGECATIGFMANEVKEKFPEFVNEYCGFQVINYNGLLAALEN